MFLEQPRGITIIFLLRLVCFTDAAKVNVVTASLKQAHMYSHASHIRYFGFPPSVIAQPSRRYKYCRPDHQSTPNPISASYSLLTSASSFIVMAPGRAFPTESPESSEIEDDAYGPGPGASSSTSMPQLALDANTVMKVCTINP